MRSSFAKTLCMVLGDSRSVIKFRWALVLLNCVSAIHDDHLPGNVRSLVGTQEHNRGRNLFRTSRPSNGRISASGNLLIGRPGRPEEVAAAIVFLCSDEASYVTGQMII